MMDLIISFLGIAPADVIGTLCVYATSCVLVILVVDFVLSCFRRLIGFY